LVSYHVDIRRVINRQVALAIADGTMSVDGETVFVVKNMKVATFLSTDDM
jgi:3-hydroxyacyl-[acyl-carrier protein] dehydratase/trans-2-decenoyl-[acyl-carrier protein] isomerase